MTIEAYVQSVLDNNPDFVAAMNARISTDYSDKIHNTQSEFQQRMARAKENWLKNRGEDAYVQNYETIRQHVKSDIPRYAFIKHINLNNDTFEIEVDLLNGTWSLIPV